MSNAGKDTLDWLYTNQLNVDEKWSVRTEQGFKWWAHQQAQTIEITKTITGPGGLAGYLISVHTEVLKAFVPTADSLAQLNTLVMHPASMCGPVYDPKSQSLSLHSLINVYDDIKQWMQVFISLAAVLQIDEAKRIATTLIHPIGGEPAFTGPIEQGLRPEPDEMAGIVDSVIRPLGTGPSPWQEAEFEHAVENYMQRLPSTRASFGGNGLTVEFPYGHSTSLCRMVSDETHPRYGNGLLIYQCFPVTVQDHEAGIRLALSLNEKELTEQPFGYGFGSYSYKEGLIAFSCFLPNSIYRPKLLPNLYYACANRAAIIDALLTTSKQTGSH